MSKNQPSRAAKMAKEIGQKMKLLTAQGQIAPEVLTTPSSPDKDTPEMRKKRRLAVEKLRTFLD